MAVLEISLEEVSQLIEQKLKTNEKVQVVSVRPEGKDIAIKLKAAIFPVTMIYLQFEEYRDGILHFHLSTNKLMNALLKLIPPNPAPFLRVSDQKVEVDVEQLIAQKMAGLKIRQLYQEPSGPFRIELDLSDLGYFLQNL